MFSTINLDKLPLNDLFYSGLIIFIMSIILANIFNPLIALTYALVNILTLTFLGWLYQETWSDQTK
tara:strand:+ start:2017 stop:2214 length:198 start_codon:yes stop_codon:yes gene_type:complete